MSDARTNELLAKAIQKAVEPHVKIIEVCAQAMPTFGGEQALMLTVIAECKHSGKMYRLGRAFRPREGLLYREWQAMLGEIRKHLPYPVDHLCVSDEVVRLHVTPDQSSAVSALWSAQLRAKVAASEAERRARAPSVVMSIDPEDL